MNDVEHTTLDYIDNIVVPGRVFDSAKNEYWALICLRDGMDFLYKRVYQCDTIVKQRMNPDDKLEIFCLGNDPAMADIPQALLTCAFHWYAISACNYVRTVGAIADRYDPCFQKPIEYVERVIPEVLAFRDKIAAHFAWSTKNEKDNEAERMASILPPLTFHNDSFYVGEMVTHLRKSEKISTSEAIQPWSIYKVHKELQKRYWPEKVEK